MELTLKPVTDNKEQEEVLLRECKAIREKAFSLYPNVGEWTRSFNWRLAYIYEELLKPYRKDSELSMVFLPGVEISNASEFASALADTSNDVEWIVEAFSRAHLQGGSGDFNSELKDIVYCQYEGLLDTDRDF
tara:strand:+ start:344 stop:742 length:399 start_codon:yes stop_codon:yes gene_type:complete